MEKIDQAGMPSGWIRLSDNMSIPVDCIGSIVISTSMKQVDQYSQRQHCVSLTIFDRHKIPLFVNDETWGTKRCGLSLDQVDEPAKALAHKKIKEYEQMILSIIGQRRVIVR
jgi:hypothetical protein